ncbi:unnamed protein product [Parajaminaea phylloscopi]
MGNLRHPPPSISQFFADVGLSPPALSHPLQLCTIALGWKGAKHLWGGWRQKPRATLRDPMADEGAKHPHAPEAQGHVILAASTLTALKVLPQFVSTPGHPMKHNYWPNICTQPRLVREGFNKGMQTVIGFLRDQLTALGADSSDLGDCRSRCKLACIGCRSPAYLIANQLWRLETLDKEITLDCLSLAMATQESSLGIFTLTLQYDGTEGQHGQWTVAVSSTPYLDHFVRAKILSVNHLRVLLWVSGASSKGDGTDSRNSSPASIPSPMTKSAIEAKRAVNKAPRQQIGWPEDFNLDPAWLSRQKHVTKPVEERDAESEALKKMLWPEHRPCLEKWVPLVSLLETEPESTKQSSRREGSKKSCKGAQSENTQRGGASEGLPGASTSGTSAPTPPADSEDLAEDSTRASTPTPGGALSEQSLSA